MLCYEAWKQDSAFILPWGILEKKGILLAFEYFEVPNKDLYLKYCKHWLYSLAYTYKLCNFILKEYHTSKPKKLLI